MPWVRTLAGVIVLCPFSKTILSTGFFPPGVPGASHLGGGRGVQILLFTNAMKIRDNN